MYLRAMIICRYKFYWILGVVRFVSTHFSKLKLLFYTFKILILAGKSPILLTLVPVNKCIVKVCMCNHHVCIIIIHSKANVNYLLPTCARTAYKNIVYLSNFYL